MKNFVLLKCYILGFFMLCGCLAVAKDILTFMSYNVRRKGKDPIEHQWDNRKELVFKQILSKRPTIIGFQEVVKGKQYKDLKKGLPGYRSFGKPRSKKSKSWLQWVIMKYPRAQDECNPIFYNPKHVQLIKSETVGINPPNILFPSWLPRIFSYGLFKDVRTQKKFCVINTHLDKDSKTIRNKQIHLILKYVTKNADDLPVIIMGDFNAPIEGNTQKILYDAHFVHAKENAITRGPKKTRTGWKDNKLKEIDHILLKNAMATEYEVVQNPQGQYPSDHQPVYAKVILL